MDAHDMAAFGERLRAARVALPQTQAVVAGLAGITTDYLYQLERGKKLPTIAVLMQLAAVLRVPVGTLLGDAVRHPSTGRQVHLVGDVLYTALIQPIPVREPSTIGALHQRVMAAWQTWQTSPNRYSALTSDLPALVNEVVLAEQQVLHTEGHQHHHPAFRCAADLYALMRTVAKRLGRLDLALLVADRAVRAAAAADDVHRLAIARWNFTHVLLAQQEAEAAEAMARHAAEAVASAMAAGDADAAALYGALTLLGAVANVRRGKVWDAREQVRAVVPLAERTGERNIGWTAFGPTNVAMYAVSVEVEAGDAAEALHLAEQVGYDRSPSIERRVAFLLEQAKGYEQQRDYASSLLVLQAAAREAPEDVAHRPAARALLRTVRQHGRRSVAHEAAVLATGVGVSLD